MPAKLIDSHCHLDSEQFNDDREAVIVAFAAPGNYTGVVRGKNNTTGVALVEAYRVP